MLLDLSGFFRIYIASGQTEHGEVSSVLKSSIYSLCYFSCQTMRVLQKVSALYFLKKSLCYRHENNVTFQYNLPSSLAQLSVSFLMPLEKKFVVDCEASHAPPLSPHHQLQIDDLLERS